MNNNALDFKRIDNNINVEMYENPIVNSQHDQFLQQKFGATQSRWNDNKLTFNLS